MAGISEATLRRWISKGKTASAGTRFGQFFLAVEEAEAAARLRALAILYAALPENPGLAWRFLERKEPGFQPPRFATLEVEDDEPSEPRSVIDELARARRLTKP